MATKSVQDLFKSTNTNSGKLTADKPANSQSTLSDVAVNGGALLFNTDTSTVNPSIQTPGKAADVSSMSTGNGENITATNMFEYMMGIKEVALEYQNFAERQALVTKPIEVVGNVKEIELVTNENHPVFDSVGGVASTRQTSIEYYISYKDNPSQGDWISILPQGQINVVGERLFFNGIQAILRFPSEVQTIKLYKNGIALSKDEFVIINSSTVSLKNMSPHHIYTADYKPDATKRNPWTIALDDFKSDVRRAKETFEGTAYNKTIQLSYYPYIDYEMINSMEDYNPNTSEYQPISVKLIDGSIAGPRNTRLQTVFPFSETEKTYTYNKTLYKDKSWSEMKDYSLDPDDLYTAFDYYQWKNKVVFTETFNAAQIAENHQHTHGNATIEIEYDYLATNFRMKAILRRNSSSEIAATPELLNYSIKFKTVK